MSLTARPGVRISAQIGGFYEWLPKNYDPKKKYPLFIFMHGAGETGPGTSSTLGRVLNNLPAQLIRNGSFPVEAIVIVPQTLSAVSDATTAALIDYVVSQYPALGKKVVVSGLSLGGNFSMKAAILRPDNVWAAVPMCAAYDLTQANADKVAAAKIPSWWFHGTSDGTISVGKTRSNVKKLQAAGANVKTTYFEGKGHDIWDDATFYKDADGTFIDWAMSIIAKGTEVEEPEEPGEPTPVYDTFDFEVSPSLNLKEPTRINGSLGKFITAQFGPQSVSPASPATNALTYGGPRYSAFSANKKPAKLALSDLDPKLDYDISILASRGANASEATIFQGGYAIPSYNNYDRWWSIVAQPDADGRIEIDLSPAKSYAYVSAVKVKERP